MVRKIDQQTAADDFDPARWVKAQIAEAAQHGTITAKDAQRLSALVAPAHDGPSARQLFEDALADPESTPAAIGLLSLAQYNEQHSATDDLPHNFEVPMVLTFTGGSAVFLAIETAKHLHIRLQFH